MFNNFNKRNIIKTINDLKYSYTQEKTLHIIYFTGHGRVRGCKKSEKAKLALNQAYKEDATIYMDLEQEIIKRCSENFQVMFVPWSRICMYML